MSLVQFVNKVGEELEQGDVVVIASRQPDIQEQGNIPTIEVDLTQRVHDTGVCGVVQNLYVGHKHESGDEPQGGGEEKKSGRSKRERASAKTVSTHASQAFTMSELETLDQTRIAVGQIGYLMTGGLCRVCKVDADIAPIKAGDLLTTSPTKGHAQKVTNAAETVGAVLGKALGSLKKGKGTIPVLVTL